MNKAEQEARNRFQSGYNCAQAVYLTFNPDGTAPTPRDEGGKCGTVLAAEKLLGERGEDTAKFDGEFLMRFGSVKCSELRRMAYPCIDLVGTVAGMIEKAS